MDTWYRVMEQTRRPVQFKPKGLVRGDLLILYTVEVNLIAPVRYIILNVQYIYIDIYNNIYQN